MLPHLYHDYISAQDDLLLLLILFSDLYSLPNIVRVVKSRRMRWAGHVARMG